MEKAIATFGSFQASPVSADARADFQAHVLTSFTGPEAEKQDMKALNQTVLDDASTSEFTFFEYKTNVVEEEIHAFLEIHGAFASLENLVNSNLQNQKELRKEIDDTASNPQTVYGVFKKQSKDERLGELREKLRKCDFDCEVSSELFSIVTRYVLAVEIPNFKRNHHLKWNFILHSFAEDRRRRLQNETAFWEKLSGYTPIAQANDRN